MTRLAPVLILITLASGAAAQERVFTRDLTCAALRARVARDHSAILATSATAYETVHRDSGSCRLDETATPAFEPAGDQPSCLAGWRCQQRNSDSNPR